MLGVAQPQGSVTFHKDPATSRSLCLYSEPRTQHNWNLDIVM